MFPRRVAMLVVTRICTSSRLRVTLFKILLLLLCRYIIQFDEITFFVTLTFNFYSIFEISVTSNSVHHCEDYSALDFFSEILPRRWENICS